jgi:hypothetical protein
MYLHYIGYPILVNSPVARFFSGRFGSIIDEAKKSPARFPKNRRSRWALDFWVIQAFFFRQEPFE